MVSALGLLSGCWRPERKRNSPAQHAAPRSGKASLGRTEASPGTARRSMPAVAPIVFQDVTGKTGIDFKHTDGSSGRHYIVESVCAGLALFDYDGDGDVDIYFLNGSPLEGADVQRPPRNALFRNEGDWRFTDATEEAGLGDTGFGLGVAAADYDNDGDQDLYLNNFGPNVLYRNNGDGTFTNVARETGVENGHKVGAGVCFLDIDQDGDLDLYAANYVKFSHDAYDPFIAGGFPSYPGPDAFEAEPDTLYRNNADGTFTDISIPSGITAHAKTGMGTVAGDYDRDGDTDIFVCNDVRENFFFENDGTGKFQQRALAVGLAYNIDGEPNASMGVDCADYDNDGWLDLFMTDYQTEYPVLYRNLGDGSFEDVTASADAGAGTVPFVTWGTGLVDFDNDGDRDIFIACGHTQDNIERIDDTTSYYTCNVLLMNTGDGRFVNVSETAGSGMSVRLASRGAAFDDLDGDGDVDAVVLNIRREPTILRNESDNANHWIQIRLRGVHTNRDGVGARVTVSAGNLVQVDEVHSGRGYQSHYGTRLHFGLGQRDHVDSIEVRWIGGRVDVIQDVAVDQLLMIAEENTSSNGPQRPADGRDVD